MPDHPQVARPACASQAALPTTTFRLDDLAAAAAARRTELHCRGCENRCTVTRLNFANGNVFYTGNRCERIYTNRGQRRRAGVNLPAEKRTRLFDRPTLPVGPSRGRIGLPRALNIFENYPFWATLLTACGFEVVLSDPSSSALGEGGAATVMSENICYPAKLLNGHIFNLLQTGVDRIFFPMVFFEQREFKDAINVFNCPVVSGYADVIRSAIDPAAVYDVPLDQPAISFQDRGLLRAACAEYLGGLGVDRRTFAAAFERALAAQQAFKDGVRQRGAEVIAAAEAAGRQLMVLVGHPYHLDPLINHKIPEMLAEMGVDVLTEDSLPLPRDATLDEPQVLSQWEYLNRTFYAARWAGPRPGVEVVQLNSFGCGPDAFALDETRGLLSEYGKHLTVLRIDEIDSPGSTRLRLRSLLETLAPPAGVPSAGAARRPRPTTRLYRRADRQKTILVPQFSRFCTPAIIRPAQDMGHLIEVLPTPTPESVEVGLKYTNNEICYPGVIVIGDLIRALQSGDYDPSQVIAGSWETGGQCRASNISCLLKKALVAAGFQDVPVITLSTRLQPFNRQPEFKFNFVSYALKAMLSMLYSDGISGLYHAAVVREKVRGDADALADRWMRPLESGTMPLTKRAVLDGLRGAVADFRKLALRDLRLPKVGIVGEIYVKYNTFSNSHIVQWLTDQGLEVVLPPLLTFFLGSFVGQKEAVRNRVNRRDALYALSRLGKRIVQPLLSEAEAILHTFPFYPTHRPIEEVAASAADVVQLTHRYGEAWLLSGEIGEFVKAGVNNVLCLQPFGCIANHVIAKGVAKRLQAVYPALNLLYLDLDAGGSEVNLINRAHFFVEQARAGASG